MKVESYVLLFVGIFFGLVGLTYWLMSSEDAGTVMLLGTFLFGLRARWLLPVVVAAHGPRGRPTIPTASLKDGAGVVGAFPDPASGRSSSASAPPSWAWHSSSEPGRLAVAFSGCRGPRRGRLESRRGGLV